MLNKYAIVQHKKIASINGEDIFTIKIVKENIDREEIDLAIRFKEVKKQKEEFYNSNLRPKPKDYKDSLEKFKQDTLRWKQQAKEIDEAYHKLSSEIDTGYDSVYRFIVEHNTFDWETNEAGTYYIMPMMRTIDL